MSESTAPAARYAAVTPNDSTVVGARSLYIGTTGNVALKADANATAVTFTNVPVGFMPVGAYIVMSTNTTASGIVALY
ncbi:hypothetical protein HJB79_31455 [Rhizobium lentis]|uniref:spike base protein, RCAP_Rcc01079 family n=1 Tax=Rhizobium lentis TaxID=1138194 RepID=UPI001C832970|nr:hypothetical protein [Rhizobium lentis]MBX5143227.1 hypothetical protein [Rhizobium lentis]